MPQLALAVATIVGCTITATTTYALVRHVQHLIANATVTSDPKVWLQEARTRAYDACYFGCDDCDDPQFAHKACQTTAAANVTGILCDGTQMWNWKDRYPVECLQALGTQYQKAALKAKKQSYRNQLALIILTIVAGLAGAILVYCYWKRRFPGRARRETYADRWPRQAPTLPPDTPTPPPSYDSKEMHSIPQNHNPHPKGIWHYIFTFPLFALFGLFQTAHSYACTGHNSVHNQYFVNDNRTIFGVVYGWFSNCYDVTDCTTTCSTSCSGGGGTSGGGGSCSTSCDDSCYTVTYTDRSPEDYVNYTLPTIEACGFGLVDAVEGDVNLRVANPGIERLHWVRISVNGYNVTDRNITDDQIWCLHRIGD